jgi:hypothetical protein
MHDEQLECAPTPGEAPLVTLDQNTLIALRNHEPAASAVEMLLTLNRQRQIIVNITMSTMMEARRPGDSWTPEQVHMWLLSLGIAGDRIFTSSETLAFNTLNLPGVAVFDIDLEIQLNQAMHDVLFPKIAFYWQDYFAAHTHDLTSIQLQAIAELMRRLHGMTRMPPWPTPACDSLGEQERHELTGGADRPDNRQVLCITPMQWHRRMLHRQKPAKGGIRSPYGGTRSCGVKRGTLVTHPRYGVATVGGTREGRISLHDPRRGKRLTQTADPAACRIRTELKWRVRLLPVPSTRRVSAARTAL